MKISALPVPSVAPHEVLITVAAAGVNRADILQRQGKYPPPVGAPDILGLEVSGEIAAVGAEVTRWHAGDKVCALLPGGGYADYAVAQADLCLPIPRSISIVNAASLPEAAFTVWCNIIEIGKFMRGDVVLVHGGSSGIGSLAVQLIVALGGTVFVTAGSNEKCAYCMRLGAAVAVNYKTQDFIAAVKDATAGHGVNIILDMVGGDYLARNVEALASGGRLVSIATQRGVKGELNILQVMQKRLTITGFTLRNAPLTEKIALAQAVEQNIWPLFASGQIHPTVFKTFSLSDAASAHALMEAGHHMGKLVLTV